MGCHKLHIKQNKTLVKGVLELYISYKKGCAGAYRYGFNGQEKVDEIKGVGNYNTALFWEYDTRLGRRWNLDPVDQVSVSNYACFGNNPVRNTDVLGDSNVNFFNVQQDPKYFQVASLTKETKGIINVFAHSNPSVLINQPSYSKSTNQELSALGLDDALQKKSSEWGNSKKSDGDAVIVVMYACNSGNTSTKDKSGKPIIPIAQKLSKLNPNALIVAPDGYVRYEEGTLFKDANIEGIRKETSHYPALGTTTIAKFNVFQNGKLINSFNGLPLNNLTGMTKPSEVYSKPTVAPVVAPAPVPAPN